MGTSEVDRSSQAGFFCSTFSNLAMDPQVVQTMQLADGNSSDTACHPFLAQNWNISGTFLVEGIPGI
jgi:hypothetical protein